MILRPGTANSIANLGWPGNKIKNKQKKTAVTIYKLNILGREEKKPFIQKEKNGLNREVMKKKKTKMLMMGRRNLKHIVNTYRQDSQRTDRCT